MVNDTELLRALEADPFHAALTERAWPVTDEELDVLAVVIALEDAWSEAFEEGDLDEVARGLH